MTATTVAARAGSDRPSRSAPRAAALTVFAGAAALGVGLSFHIAGGGALLAVRWRLLLELGLWALAWLVAVAAAFRLPKRTAVLLIAGAALALRVAALAGPPVTSDDLFRYSWDGRVQAAGIDPYRYPPQSPALAGFREQWLWPGQRPCPLAYRPGACTRINRAWAPTIYPPAAEAWFGAVYRLTGIGARHKPWQVAGLVTDTAVVALLVAGLRRRGRDPRWAALYALSPAPVLEVVNNGHVDGLAILLSVAALIVASPPADRAGGWPPARRELLAGTFVGLAVLVKLYPALLVVAIAAGSADRRRRSLGRVGGTASGIAAAGYLPHVAAVGHRVAGFLPGYFREEHYDGAGRYLVAGAARLPGDVAALVSALAVLIAVAWVWRRRPPATVGATVLLGTLLAATSPVQPWYAVMLLAFAALAAEPGWAALAVAGYPYFFSVILLGAHQVGIGQLSYGIAVAVVAATASARRIRRLR